MENKNYVSKELSENGLECLRRLTLKDGLHTKIFEDLLEECEDLEGTNLKDKILQFIKDVNYHGAIHQFYSLRYHEDTDRILENYSEEIHNFIEEQIKEDMEDTIKVFIIGNDVLLHYSTTRSQLVCYIYENVLTEIEYILENEEQQ
jgi:hypothetical protein